MRITVLAGGIGAARFLLGLKAAAPEADITVIGNTGDDIWIHGLRVCPDLDTVMYTLGDGISKERGWGREDETFTVKAELADYGFGPDWFGLGDRDIATHLIRRQLMDAGEPLSRITAALCARWEPGVTLIPMTDQRAETHVTVVDPDGGVDDFGRPLTRAMHFQEWWIRYRASLPALAFTLVGAQNATPAPGVTEAIRDADVVLLPPSNPVVSIGTILQIPGIRESLRSTPAPVVGVSPIIGGRPVRGMADACLKAIGVETDSAAVASHYGPRRTLIPAGGDGGGILDGWVMDTSDAEQAAGLNNLGIRTAVTETLMSDPEASRALAAAALDLAGVS